jgi:CheY-like chemotaxis protein
VIKLLYVEDNDDNVYMLKMRLELLGDFEVLAAEDGEKGCEMALSEQPDIILMDSGNARHRRLGSYAKDQE